MGGSDQSPAIPPPVHGAGHACQLEQPWLFDQYMIEFLKKHELFPVK
jgi:hypothetical protein